jgi:hypothetical protein
MLNIWNPAIPRKTDWFYDVFKELRIVKGLFRERFELDHYSESAEDPTDPTCDGFHKFITLKPIVPNLLPTFPPGDLYPVDWDNEVVKQPTDSGTIYMETVDGVPRLRYTTEVGGEIIRSTLR